MLARNGSWFSVLALLFLVAKTLMTGTALAQDGDDKSRFVRFVERTISAPGRQVSLTGFQGVFSANPSVERIVVSDSQGPWLEIDDAALLWTRTALFRGMLDIDWLTAQRVTLLRRPAPAEADDEGGASTLPVEMDLDAFRFAEVVVAAAVAGTEARLTAEGSAEVTEEAVAASLAVTRNDRPGQLSGALRFHPDADVLTADLQISEPEGGLLAELMQLRGRPAVSISVDGEGPLTDWQAKVAVEAGGTRVLAGGAALSRLPEGYLLSAELAGALGPIAPDSYAALLSGESRLALNILRDEFGGFDVRSASLRSDGVELAASGALGPDLLPSRADFSLRLGQAGRTTVPFAPGQVSVASLHATLGLDPGDAAPWRADIAAEGVLSDYGAVANLEASGTGQASNLADPAARTVSFRAEGSADGVSPADAGLAQALGSTARLSAAGAWAAGQPLTFESLQAVLTGATASFAGTTEAGTLDGRFGASIADLTRFSLLLDRPVEGRAQLQATGNVAVEARTFSLALEGDAESLRLGLPALDPLLAGTTRVKGGISRDADSVSFDDLALESEQVSASLNGSLADPALDLSVTATVADLAALTPRAQGRAELTAHVTGTSAAPRVEAETTGGDVVLMGRPLSGASARFSGTVAGPETAGRAEVAGLLGDVPLSGSAELSAGEGGARRIGDLLVTVGQSRASGDLTVAADGLLTGNLAVVSPDLSKVGPLFLVEAGGMLKADIALAAEHGAQTARFSGVATDIVYEDVALETVDLEGVVRNVFAAPQIDGRFAVRNVNVGGLQILSADGTAERRGDVTGFAANAALADGSAALAGEIRPGDERVTIALDSFAFSRTGIELRLAAPAAIAVVDGAAEFSGTRFTAGGGSVTLAGRAGSTLALTADFADVPTGLANNFAPELGAEGTLSGRATVTGPAAAPVAEFDATWADASVAAARNAGLGPLAITANGRFADRVVRLASRISGPEGMALQVAGTVGAAAGAPLDLKVTGAVPLSLGNRQLAGRGAALEGALAVDLTVSGTNAAPVFAGRVTSEGGAFIDPTTGVVLRDLALAASVSDNRLVLERLTAKSGDGTVSGEGSIGLAVGSGFPADLRATIRQARYVDGSFVSTRFDADLTLTGALATGPVIGGSVFLDRTEIVVPESLPGDSVAVDVEHVNAPADVAAIVALSRSAGGSRRPGAEGPGWMKLDLTVKAPQQIFVRGRGLDAELGGELRLTGTTGSIVADGSFEMNRGRLDIFTQRISFDRGIVSFAGDLDPVLDFSGTTRSEDVAITVSVAGRASDPEVTFSSVPELPQDEVLARLIFNKGLAELSPVQIARLADAAAQLAGGSGSGLLNQLRASTGLDDLDIVADEEGGAALAAGRYVNENVYVGVQQGTSARSSRVTVDLDITDDVKARAAMSPQGDSSLGVFYEHEY